MKRLWAPLAHEIRPIPSRWTLCVLQGAGKSDGVENLVVFRGQSAFVILNRYPYTSGHLMVVANLHLPTLEDLDKATRSEMMELSAHGMQILRQVYHPEAFNFGANIGEAAGAGIAGHVHLHLVPRWGGDTNFMSTLAGTRVLPEQLEDTYRRISAAWKDFMNSQLDFDLSRLYAGELDSRDPLASFRAHFVISDPDLIYLDGNSLGRLPHASLDRVRHAVEQEWGCDLVRGWNENWWQAPLRLGEKIARLVGAASDQVIACDTVSVNLFKLASAALALRPDRTRILTDTLNFPSDLYILQGLVRLLGGRHSILRIGSSDGDITPDLDALAAAIDDTTALLTLSHVTFKSGYLYDMAAVTELAHRHGALVIWDLSHSAGAVPVALDACNADFAVGCTYKYINGGPGAPGFLYARRDLQEQALSPLCGWWGQDTPFAFGLDYHPAPGVARFLTGSQPVLSLLAMEAALDPLLEAGMEPLRRKSLLLCEYLIHLSDVLLSPLGFTLGSPRLPERRGSHVSLRHPEGYRINRALIEQMNVLPDFREPDNLRLGLAPLYTTFTEVWEAVDRILQVVQEQRYLQYPSDRQTVT